jgi:hypothetical protein
MDSQSSLNGRVDSPRDGGGTTGFSAFFKQLVQPSVDALMLASLSEIFISVIALSNSDD